MSNCQHYWAESQQLADIKIAKYVDLVFERLAEFHTVDKRNKAIGMVNDEAAVKASWAREFCLMTPEMVEYGGRKIKGQKFCPNLAQFTQLCKPSDEEAYAEAQIGMQARLIGDFGVWSCPAVYFSAVEFGLSRLREMNWERAAVRFSKIYERAVARQERGELGLIPKLVPIEKRLESAKVSSIQDVAKIEKLVKQSFGGTDVNHKIWAFAPRSFYATCEMLNRAKSGHINEKVVEQNIKAGTIVKDGAWFKPVGYLRGNKLVVCVS